MTANAVQVVAVQAGPELSSGPAVRPADEHRKLDIFIGRWINEGQNVAQPGVPAVKIVTSDVYEWAPGGFFVIHSAYGRIGDLDVGGVEIIDYDPEAGCYGSRFFDSQGNVSFSRLTEAGGIWTWTGERTRCRASFSDDGRIQTAHHERSDDGKTWQPSMEVVLRKVG